MKKFLKKLIKKIKESKLFQKFSCFLVISMILISTFSVSAFAAQDGFLPDPGAGDSSDLHVPSDESSAADTITDLTGTTWEFTAGEWTATAGYGQFRISFILDELDGDTSYDDGIGFNNVEFSIGYQASNDGGFPYPVPVLDSLGLFPDYPLYVSNSQSFTLTFTGGDDIDDPSLVTWVRENGNLYTPPTPTESITDVWTSIVDGIMSLINAAQGVFFGSSADVSYTVDPIAASAIPSSGFNYYFHGLPEFNVGDEVELIVYSAGASLTYNLIVTEYDGSLGTLELSPLDSDFPPFLIVYFPAVSGARVIEHEPGWYANFDYDTPWPAADFTFTVPGTPGLTFLGTLAVLAVALAVILLLIYVVINFIRLRG